jgi:DNA-directed RNA polymerase subunit H (RpoH/RPB5)
MQDLLEHEASPKYEVMNPSDIEPFLISHNLTRKQMHKMYEHDHASRYLFLQKKQIVRIIRNSELTGYSVDYRVII